jgi:hypothetical protein
LKTTSTTTVKLANNPMASNMTKYVDIKHPCFLEELNAEIIAVVSVGKALMHVGTWNDEGATGTETHHDLQPMHGSGAGWRIALLTLPPMI